jgi:hypothetical protein
MIDNNRKRYVYLDKYMEFQGKVNMKIDHLNRKVNLLTYVVMGIIVAASYAMIQIFG